MIDNGKTQDREEILFAFHEAYQQPNAEQIIEWVERYPQFADDIRAHAAVEWDLSVQPESEVMELDESLSARCYSQALNLIYDSENAVEIEENSAPLQTLQDLRCTKGNGKEIHEIASQLDIGRGVLSALFNGSMLPPIRRRIVEAITSLFSISDTDFGSALDRSLKRPQFGYAKAKQTPIVTPRPCDEIIRGSNMTEDRKRYWLEED